MIIYLIIFLIILFFSFYYDILGKKDGRNLWYLFILLLLVLLSGLRWRLGIDTPNYIYKFYYLYPSFEQFSFNDYPIGKDPFFVLINSIVKSLKGKFFVVQLIQATIVNGLIFMYIKKRSDYIFTCVLFYYIVAYIGFNMEIMRGSLSIAICLFANDYILEKKFVKGYALYTLALMFHSQTILLFFLPVLFSLRLNKVSIVVIIAVLIIGSFIQSKFGSYLDLIDIEDSIAEKAEKYIESEHYSVQNGNLNYIVVNIFPNIIYGIISLLYIKRKYPRSKLLELEPMIVIGIVFLIAQISVQISYRYVDYYRIYFILFAAEVFVKLIRHSKNQKILPYIRSAILFFPFLFLLLYPRILTGKSVRYFPYSSVINREINIEREIYYSSVPNVKKTPYTNEY